MRRFALALPLLAAGLFPGPGRADVVFVINSMDPGIQVVDPVSRAELRQIPVLREPHHLTLTPAKDLLLVGDSGGNEILFLDASTGEVRKRERISNPYNLEFSPDGKLLVVTGLRRDQVDIYSWDAASMGLTLLTRLRPGDMPSHIAYRPDSKLVYVTLQGSRSIAAIDLEKREILWNLQVGREPAGIIWHNGKLLVGIMGSDHVAVVDPEARKLERTIRVGRGAHALFPTPGGGPIYVTSRVDSRITALDPVSLDVVRTYEVPGGPDCLSFDEQGRIWATLRWNRQLGMLDPATGEVTTSPVGRSPHGIFFRNRSLVQARNETPSAPVER
ncbi:beta-propeller fold lactonase family protein [Roseomonas sp. SSH11]|uniref:Beta-propeller fold lactonase family protein n=1 Tax=Pararoseomonas baculiformis TaxID=2820812 RepID=A0ABS4AJN5_9PROT|nr:YncE family protein [Pararoseomonas baculiformis]MBP0447247.1 beta-propeller fold lactonase family protein [Pararoseomonas baculiformis]